MRPSSVWWLLAIGCGTQEAQEAENLFADQMLKTLEEVRPCQDRGVPPPQREALTSAVKDCIHEAHDGDFAARITVALEPAVRTVTLQHVGLPDAVASACLVDAVGGVALPSVPSVAGKWKPQLSLEVARVQGQPSHRATPSCTDLPERPLEVIAAIPLSSSADEAASPPTFVRACLAQQPDGSEPIPALVALELRQDAEGRWSCHTASKHAYTACLCKGITAEKQAGTAEVVESLPLTVRATTDDGRVVESTRQTTPGPREDPLWVFREHGPDGGIRLLTMPRVP